MSRFPGKSMAECSKSKEHEFCDTNPSVCKSNFPGKSMAESSKSKEHELIDIKPSSICDDFQLERRRRNNPLLISGSRRHGDTWVISLFVILHTGVFIATMLVNDCWTNSHGDCAFKDLGRLSFQPLSENPLLGPSESK